MFKVVKGLPAEWGTCSRTISLDNTPWALSCWKNTIAVGLWHKDIITFNVTTGSQKAVFSGHTDEVNSLVFSSDGTSLVSGSSDKTVKFWDVQTGGVVKTFAGHTNKVWSVSISADCTRIASGSGDHTICLWDILTGECHCVIKQQDDIYHVCFSPTNHQYLLSISNNKVRLWANNGHQLPSIYDGSHVAFSPDGTQFVLCNGAVVTIQNSDSRAIVAEFHITNSSTGHCCFSPDGRLVAVAAGSTAYVWDITGLDPCPVGTFIGHTNDITSLTFSSPTSLTSASKDRSVKFWQIGASPINPVETDPKSTPLASAPITVQTKDGITTSIDSDGVVRIWDISTGICKTSFQTPAKDPPYRDVQLIDGRLILVWHAEEKIHIWDTEKGELLQTADAPRHQLEDFRISGDGSKIFCLYYESIQAWSIQTGEDMGRVKIEHVIPQRSLTVYGSKAWIHCPQSEYQGWDFGIPDSSPIQLLDMPTLHLSGPMVWDISQSRLKNTVTGKMVFQMSGRFAKPIDVQCDGYHLAARYYTGEVLILEFDHEFLQ